MSLTPPIGYGYFAATFSLTGTSRNQVNTWGFQNAAGYSSAGSALLAAYIAFTGTNDIYDPANYVTTMSLIQFYCLLNVGGLLFSAENVNPVPGTSTFNPVSPNVSGVVNKHTALAGRQYRGRVALPSGFLDEADVDRDGHIGPSAAHLQTCLNNTKAVMAGLNLPLVLLHAPNHVGFTPPPTAISSLTMSTVVGTSRRRLKRI